MKYLMTGAAALGALALVAISPGTAEARHGWWGGPSFSIYVGPRYPHYGYYSYRYRHHYHPYAYGYGPRWKYRYRDRDWD
ncbi:hypothetical protein [Methyloceanibacter sp.]|uniref:hypothetical protein n=1 Tax=Methyloceanibacter sp. TaxID=1965321 RepID=UPI002D3E6EA5|nr:hypothetical protein [Methyloceanibacter sp.]HZP10019.1 hypothetical protein [Methyloceanibacter sp.]